MRKTVNTFCQVWTSVTRQTEPEFFCYVLSLNNVIIADLERIFMYYSYGLAWMLFLLLPGKDLGMWLK